MEEANGSRSRECRPRHKHGRSCQTGIESESTDDTPDSVRRGMDSEMASQPVKQARGDGVKTKKKKKRSSRRKEDVREEEKEEEPVMSGVSVTSSREELAMEESCEVVRVRARRRQRDAGERRAVNVAADDNNASDQESHHGNQSSEDTRDGGVSCAPKIKRAKKRGAAPTVGADMEDKEKEISTPHKKRKTSTCAKTKIAHRDGENLAVAGGRDGHSQAEAPTKQLRVIVKNAQEVALDYLHLWNTDRKLWSFRKKTQYWLLQNLYDKKQVCVYR